ncbi:MAG: hypothetical protein P8X39_11600, partial [Desulfofustis sp.]
SKWYKRHRYLTFKTSGNHFNTIYICCISVVFHERCSEGRLSIYIARGGKWAVFCSYQKIMQAGRREHPKWLMTGRAAGRER